MTSLAERGAQIVALTPSLSDPLPQLLIPVIQQATNNPLVFAEECDIYSPASIRAFHAKLIKGRTGTGLNSEAPRVDAIVFLHEYTHVGMWTALGVSKTQRQQENETRDAAAFGTFLFSTTFLPFLLRTSSDRDVRIINVVNPVYAAAVSSFNPESPSAMSPDAATASTLHLEGERSLRSILLARHFQRVLDVLASPPVPSTDASGQTAAAPTKQSNIKFVTACPGISRAETVAPFFGAAKDGPYSSLLGLLFYIVLFPIFFAFTKSSKATSQTPLYTLYMPHPMKIRDPTPEPTPDADSPKDSTTAPQPPPQPSDSTPVIQGGELYRECRPVRLPADRGGWLMNEESVGRAVWEWYERRVDAWEMEEKKMQNGGVEDKDEPENPPMDDPKSVDEALPGLKGKLKQS
ncbi:hypothetical protein FRB99_002329 [Tulasnella sp. 403]|nr:hypothetical protein FRB99_002329 [Tulasnella sp. 403]